MEEKQGFIGGLGIGGVPEEQLSGAFLVQLQTVSINILKKKF